MYHVLRLFIYVVGQNEIILKKPRNFLIKVQTYTGQLRLCPIKFFHNRLILQLKSIIEIPICVRKRT